MILKDEELVARAKVNDQWAVEELFRRYQHKAYEIAYYMCSGNNDQAEDITQEAFVKAFKNLNTFRETASFSTWFHRIVVNTCLDEIRRRRRWERVFPFRRSGEEGNDRSNRAEESHPDPGERSNPLSVLTGKQLTRDIKKALRALSDKQRMAFQLKVFQEMSIREIAQVMESSEGTIKSHLFRATHVLRNVLKDWA
jgi:RNA polymerase sigma-70 factor, ECF subfamily